MCKWVSVEARAVVWLVTVAVGGGNCVLIGGGSVVKAVDTWSEACEFKSHHYKAATAGNMSKILKHQLQFNYSCFG